MSMIELLETVGPAHPKGLHIDVPDTTATAYISAGKAKAVSILPELPAPAAPAAKGTDGAAASGATLDAATLKAIVGEVYLAGVAHGEGSTTKGARPDVMNALGRLGTFAEPTEQKGSKERMAEWLRLVSKQVPSQMTDDPEGFQHARNVLFNKFGTKKIENFGTSLPGEGSFYSKGMLTGQDGFTAKASVQSEITGALGGFGLPIEFSQEVIRFAEEKSMLLQRVKKYPMSARQLQVPALDYSLGSTGNSPYLAGAVATWFAEGGAVPQSNLSLRQITLDAALLGILTQATRTLLADNAIAFASILTDIMAEAIGFYASYAILQGTGVNQPAGIISAPSTILVTRTGDSSVGTTFADLTTIRSKLLPGAEKTSFWMIAPSMYQKILNMTSLASTNVFLPNFPTMMGGQASYGGIMQLLGLPMEVSQLPAAAGTKGDICLIYPDGYAFGHRQDIEIAVSEHYAFNTNLLTWRGIYRADGQSRINTSLTLANGDSVSVAAIRNT